MRRALVGLLMFGALLPALPARAATTLVDVSRRLGSQAEASVAVSPTNPNDVVIASNLDTGTGIFVARSHDGGQTWQRTVVADRDAFGSACCDPTTTWEKHGNVFLGFIAYDRGSIAPTLFTILWSQDAGDTWTLFDRIEPGGGEPIRTVAARGEDEEERGGGVDQPTITAGPGGLWAIWFHMGHLEVAGARVGGLGQGRPFRAARDVPHTAGCTFGDLAIGPAGQVAQVCQRNVAGTKPRRSVLRLNIDRDGFGPKGFTAGTVVAHTNVSLFEPIRPQRFRTVDAEAGLAWDTSPGLFHGRLTLMFTDEQPDSSDDTDLWARTSDDRGATWTPRLRVVQAPRSQFLPRLALDRTTGHLALGYHTAELDDGLDPLWDTDGVRNSDAAYAIVFSADGGATWSTPVILSEGPSNAEAAANEVDYGDYTGLAFHDGVAHPAWADNSNTLGNNPNGTLDAFDIYTAAAAEP
jgi:hypothetical protein